MKYFKKYWDETSGDELTNNWGESTWYFETDDEYEVLRQLQIFEKGQVLKYSLDYLDDEFGGLTDQILEKLEFEGCEISSADFEYVWLNTTRKVTIDKSSN